MVTVVQNIVWNICTDVVILGEYIYLNAIEETDLYCTKSVIDHQTVQQPNVDSEWTDIYKNRSR